MHRANWFASSARCPGAGFDARRGPRPDPSPIRWDEQLRTRYNKLESRNALQVVDRSLLFILASCFTVTSVLNRSKIEVIIAIL